MDRLMVMEVFVKAADTGSFTAAALSLDMSPQMVGKYVASLEQRLGTRLLQRTTRRQSLTEAGRLFHAQAKRILEEVDAATRTCSRSATGRVARCGSPRRQRGGLRCCDPHRRASGLLTDRAFAGTL